MKKYRTKLIIGLGVLLVILAFLIFPYYQLVGKITGHSPLRLFFLNDQFKKTEGRVNILLLGKGDAIHDGPNLTDSMLVASYDIAKKNMFLISTPRDIWSATLEEKINAAYAFGEAKKKGGGMILAKSEIGAVVGLPIHYAVVIDFNKFKDTIDIVGGLDIDVERSFEDHQYPIKGKENNTCKGDKEYKCRYETVRFVKGPQHMSGEIALKFARSRNAVGDEGNDFARGKRQQKIMSALAVKIIGIAKNGNVKMLEELYNELDRAVERDISNEEAAFLAKAYLLSGKVELVNIPLAEELFEIPNVEDYFEKYVLIPKDNDLPALHKYIECKINPQLDC